MKKPAPRKKPKQAPKPVHHKAPVAKHHKTPAKGAGRPAAPRIQPGGPVKVAKAPKPRKKPRGLALDGEVACCTARALAESLRLALGVRVADEDVLDLYFGSTQTPDEGQSVSVALSAVQRHGLAGHFPLWLAEVAIADSPGLILGLQLPEGPHTVLAAADGWHSWGELWDPADFPGAVIEEAWAVTW